MHRTKPLISYNLPERGDLELIMVPCGLISQEMCKLFPQYCPSVGPVSCTTLCCVIVQQCNSSSVPMLKYAVSCSLSYLNLCLNMQCQCFILNANVSFFEFSGPVCFILIALTLSFLIRWLVYPFSRELSKDALFTESQGPPLLCPYSILRS